MNGCVAGTRVASGGSWANARLPGDASGGAPAGGLSHYIDELVQTTINGEPVDDPEMDPNDADHDARYYWALHNANYNVMAIVDDSGNLTERYEYTPYGERQVYFSSGGNDPLAMSPTVNSRRVTLPGGV